MSLRVLVAKFGLDGHDRGVKVVARILRDAGMEVIYTGLRQTPEMVVASAIDEFPAIFIAAACAEGETLVTGAEELRVKESDRIQTMVDGLTVLGVEAIATPDGARIRGYLIVRLATARSRT